MSSQLLTSHIRSLPEYKKLLGNISARPLGLPRSARLPVLACLHADLNQPILLITDRADHALALFDELGFWLPDAPRYLFAEPNPLFYEQAQWGASTRRERLQALTALSTYHLPFANNPSTAPIIVASARAIMTRTLPRRDYLRACKKLSAGQSIQLESLIRSWAEIGYQRVDTVLETGQFSHRGGLLDIWPMAEARPVRLDFFGDEIETIRRFDPATQRTIEKLESILITPAREYLTTEEGTQVDTYTGRHVDTEHREASLWDGTRNTQHGSDTSPPRYSSPDTEFTEFHIPLLHTFPASLFDYLPTKAMIAVDDLSLVEGMMDEVEEQAVRYRNESIEEGTLAAGFPVPYLTWSELADSLGDRPLVELGRGSDQLSVISESPSPFGRGARGEGLAEQFGHIERFAGRLKPFEEYLAKLVDDGKQVIIVSRQRGRLEELWRQRDDTRHPSPITFIEASLTEGWQLGDLYLITDSEIFGWERPTPRMRARAAAETPEAVYADLQAGDHVVHVDHGVGRFAGLVQRQLEGHEREFLAVEYEGGDTLFVPVHQADRLTRYVGADAGLPSLDRLGGQAWSEKRGKVKEAVQKVAEELLDLYARRHVSVGHAFSSDSAWQKELEDSFPYVETDDQAHALSEIKQDMERPRPMDRLLCGDVGYGKTEVALRAAFKAVMDGRQVAILVPTTVLAQQHHETFLQRLAAFPVKVEMLSRFRTAKEQDDVLVRLALGEVDIVIGTHRLISSDVQFKDLGLVVIDEEQRFGVAHKEHLKKLRTEVDVLTLTATPIPRTLYMALTGVRDISNLNTPPEERLPIVTHVGPYSPRLVRQAILREIERGGQIFFVHNRVHTIDAMKAHLQKLVPEARVDIGHGQMHEGELSAVMHRFTAGEIDILLSTSIIESGLDIPNANTLIVDRADTFGLAQLYQLRGRVGRGAMRAYAYFFRHNKINPTVDGQARLEVIAENTQLGAGYSIAMRDLEIRGAGELLGTRQHGFIQDVGFHLYTRLLADAVRQIRRLGNIPLNVERSTFNVQPMAMPVNVDLPLAIGIPADYIPDQNLRLRLYRRIADLRDESEIEALASEFRDRFGPLPEMVDSLLYQMRVKLRAEKAGLASVSWEAGQVALRSPAPAEGSEAKRLPDLASDVRGGRNVYWVNFMKTENWMPRLLEVLEMVRG
ncbi:MAG: transcription-repair coupling factor [Anaerolineae bacterium CG1_02_58_13]|nr:MAG: transcription-repair coupling factor [Anaerolineae bacterium CG1_02_58_13]